MANVDMKSLIPSQLHWSYCDNLDGQLKQLYMISFPRDGHQLNITIRLLFFFFFGWRGWEDRITLCDWKVMHDA